jgi:hypothetical protein
MLCPLFGNKMLKYTLFKSAMSSDIPGCKLTQQTVRYVYECLDKDVRPTNIIERHYPAEIDGQLPSVKLWEQDTYIIGVGDVMAWFESVLEVKDLRESVEEWASKHDDYRINDDHTKLATVTDEKERPSRIERPAKIGQLIDGVLSNGECEALIEHFGKEKMNSENEVGLWDDNGTTYHRVRFENLELSEKIWARIRPFIPAEYEAWNEETQSIEKKHPYGLLSEMRFARYTEGGLFPLHQDGKRHDGHHSSYLTLNVFLNGEFEGGETDFLNDDKETVLFSATPAAGRGALFDQEIWHRGNKVTSGNKYLLRTYILAQK